MMHVYFLFSSGTISDTINRVKVKHISQQWKIFTNSEGLLFLPNYSVSDLIQEECELLFIKL